MPAESSEVKAIDARKDLKLHSNDFLMTPRDNCANEPQMYVVRE